jgi:hypothetical protein
MFAEHPVGSCTEQAGKGGGPIGTLKTRRLESSLWIEVGRFRSAPGHHGVRLSRCVILEAASRERVGWVPRRICMRGW